MSVYWVKRRTGYPTAGVACGEAARPPEWGRVRPRDRPVPGCAGRTEAHHAGQAPADDPEYRPGGRGGDLLRRPRVQGAGKDNRRVRRIQEPSQLSAP